MTTNRGSLPRVGCVGTGWIGATRLLSLRDSGLVEVVGLCDPDPAALERAGEIAPNAVRVGSYPELLELGLDGVVVATPSALHAEQCIRAFEHGAAVFCQKPLAKTAWETRAVLSAARAADRLLAVDFCYRETSALRRAREVVRSGLIGTPYAVEAVFHNAYGPDKSWAFDPDLAGGGCLFDLGVHLVDAVLWTLDFPQVEDTSMRLFREGAALRNDLSVEDFASGTLGLAGGTTVSLACSWRSSFGDPARIRVQFFGTKGGVSFHNVGGSFHDFECELYRGTSKETLVSPPDAWGGRAIIAWADRLCVDGAWIPGEELLAVSEALDSLYAVARSDPESERARALQRESA